MPDDMDQGGFGWLVNRDFKCARLHSRAWLAVWLTGVLVVTAIAMMFSAPTAVYVILLMAADVAIDADRPQGRRS